MSRHIRVLGPVKPEDVARFIAGYLETHGYSPTFRTIGEAFHLRSKASVYRVMERAESRGLLRRLHGRVQAIEVTTPLDLPRLPTGEPLYFVSVA